jgi:glutamyl-tRNA reductase
VPFSALGQAIAQVDVLLTCTGSGSVLIDSDTVRGARAGINSALLIVDIAVPRDVDGAVAELDGVTLLDLDDLRDWAAKGIEKRSVEAESVRVIVGEEVERFTIDVTARQAAPLVAQLHEHAETIRLAELDRFSSRLVGLEPAQRAAVEAVTKGIIAKLLHSPSVRLKEDVGTPSGERNAAAVYDLFDLS